MTEILGHTIDRKTITALAATGAIMGGLIASDEGVASATSKETTRNRPCVNDQKKNVHTQFDLTSPNRDYCLREAFPMGRTDIRKDGDEGELGLVAIKLTFKGKPYACIVPVTGHGNNYTTLTPEAFSLKDDCLPDPGNK